MGFIKGGFEVGKVGRFLVWIEKKVLGNCFCVFEVWIILFLVR